MKNTQRKTPTPIKSRETKHINGKTIVERRLSCGHVQVEPEGGKAKHATYAYCLECFNEGSKEEAETPGGISASK